MSCGLGGVVERRLIGVVLDGVVCMWGGGYFLWGVSLLGCDLKGVVLNGVILMLVGWS